MEARSSRFLAERLAQGWARFRVVRDDIGRPVDSVLVSANSAFVHNLSSGGEHVAGERWSSLCPHHPWHPSLPQIHTNDGEVVSESLCQLAGRDYLMSAYADGPEHWSAVFCPIENGPGGKGEGAVCTREEERLPVSRDLMVSLVQLLQRPADSDLWFMVLEQAVRLCGGQAGYIQYYDEKLSAHHLHAYSCQHQGLCRLDDDALLLQMRTEEIWERVNESGQAMLCDDTSALTPFLKQTAAARLCPSRLLAVPVLRSGRMTALIVVLNGHHRDRESQMLSLDLLVNSMLNVIERHQVEGILHRQLAFEKLVADISTLFVDVSFEQLQHGITYALKICAEFFDVDRSYVFLLSLDGRTMNNTHEWCGPGIESLKATMQDFPVNRLSWWMDRIAHEKQVYIPDVEQLPPEASAERSRFREQGIHTRLGIPMIKEGVLQGFLGFDAVKETRIWTEGQIALLQVVTELVSSALAKHQAEERIRHLSFRDQLTGLYNRAYFHEELRRLEKSRSYPISIIAVDIDGLKLINDSLGHDHGDALLVAAGEVLRSAIRRADVAARIGGDEFGIIIPQTGYGTGLGIVGRIRQRLREYNQDSQGLPLSFSLGVATAQKEADGLKNILKNADDRMYQDKMRRLRGQRTRLIEALMNTLSKRYYVTDGDVEENTRRCLAVGERMQLSSHQHFRLALLAHAHDLGKVGIPDQIINKKDKLSEEEWEIMYQHPEKGYRIAISSPDMAEIAHLILKHHENWDGSGYPQGLSGEDIPVECRILAVVTAFSSMTHSRPYRGIRSEQAALGELRRCAGVQFDPDAVHAFAAVLAEEKQGS